MAYRPVGEVPEAVHAIARPIRGEHDVEEVVDLVANKRLVLLGEATQGTHELYDLRASITRRLIAHHGFDAVAIEGDWPDALRVDRYVRGVVSDDEDAEASLGSFERFPRWRWRNTDVAMLVTWLHAHNAALTAERRTGFYGLDLYSLHGSVHAALQYLEDNDPAAAARARDRFACFEHVSSGLQPTRLGIGPKCESEVVAQLVEMQRRKIARSGRSPAGDAWFHALQQSHVMRNAETYYRTLFADRSASWNLRDTTMADTVDLLAEHLGDGAPARLIVWAHNSHVGDARATQLGEDGLVSLGQLLRQRHPGEVALVGFTTSSGSLIAAREWDGPAERMRVGPALPGSWEELFHAAELPRFCLTSAAMRRVIGADAERLQRGVGAVYRPHTERRSHYVHARLAEELDLVIHVDATRAVESLDPVGIESAPPPALPMSLAGGV